MFHNIAEPPMDLGETLKGLEGTTLINSEKLGGVYWFDNKATRKSVARQTGKPLGAVLMRNTAGFVLLGKRLGQLDRTAGFAMNHNVDGYSAINANKGVVLIDPYLASAGCADDEIFWAIFSGPALCLLPLVAADHTADIAVNDPLVAATGTTTGVTTSGRVTHVRFAVATAGGTQAALSGFDQMYGCIGRAMSAKTSQETTAGAELLVDFSIKLFGP
jgi:hypothetical protein